MSTRKATLYRYIIMSLVISGVSWAGTYSGGSGTSGSPYQIATVADWQELMATTADWSKYFKLTGNIDLDGVTVIPIGNYASEFFTGSFDGDGYMISNVTINLPTTDCVALFGIVRYGGEVKNLGVTDVDMTGYSLVGGIAGQAGYQGGGLYNCYATGVITSNGQHAGGLVGQNHGVISNCYADCEVSTDNLVSGGLVGFSSTSGTISKCYALGDSISSYIAGGLIGYNNGAISNCYARGDATAIEELYTYAGGLIGVNAGTESITNCYATGTVTSSHREGGLVAHVVSGTFSGCFWDVDTSGTTTGVWEGSSSGIVGLPTSQMQAEPNFINAGWDFVGETANGIDDIWRMAGYPVLDGIGEGVPSVFLYPSQGGSIGYCTIQAAINDANDFDLVVANPRTYNEQIDFLGKAITVRSSDPNDWDVVEATVIDAGDLTSGTASVTFESNENANSVLSGFTITGGDYGVSVKGNWPDLPSPTIQQCIIENTGSIGIRSEDAYPIVQNNMIRNIPGQGMYIQHNSQLQINNNIFHDNDDAIQICSNNEGEVANNTIVENETGISICTMSPEIKNCIFWDNSYFSLSPDFVATYSCLDDSFNPSDPNFIGSISVDPNFVDPDNDNFHLSPGSPCIDAGDPNGVYAGQTDIDGDDRVIGDYVDMGADEVNN